MKTEHPSFILFELPAPVSEAVRELRKKYHPRLTQGPVDITVAGSSGVGPIEIGQPVETISEAVKALLPQVKPFSCRFEKMRNFPESDVFYLQPSGATIFREYHGIFARSGIKFSETPFPEYTPHCTISMTSKISKENRVRILSENFPKDSFRLSTLSLFQQNEQTLECTLLAEWKI